MGRAIVRDPQVFLFDEPLSNLDAKLRVQMRTEIKELHQRLKTTSIYVTHDQIEAMTMADQIVVMRDGDRRADRARRSICTTRPANIFVAGFIGSPAMNLVPGVARINGAAPAVEFDGGVRLPLPHVGARRATASAVLYGMRPEHCVLSPGGGLPAEVVVVEPTGADTQLYCRFDGQELTSLVRDRVQLQARRPRRTRAGCRSCAFIRCEERRAARRRKQMTSDHHRNNQPQDAPERIARIF